MLPGDKHVRVCLQALMEVVESGSKNIEVAVMRPNAKLEVLPEEQIEAVCKVLLFEVPPSDSVIVLCSCGMCLAGD